MDLSLQLARIAGGVAAAGGRNAVPLDRPAGQRLAVQRAWLDGFCGHVSHLLKSGGDLPSFHVARPTEYGRWSGDELEFLAAGRKHALPIKVIAAYLGRSVTACTIKSSRTGTSPTRRLRAAPERQAA